MAYECPNCQKPIPDAIPKDRFDEIYAERKTLKAQVENFEKEGKGATAIAAQLEAAQKELADTKTRHTVDLAMLDLGIKDQETREAIEWQYGKLPADTRAPFDEQVKAWATKPEEAPVVVRSLLPKPAAPAPAAEPAKTNGTPVTRPGFARHTNGLEGTGTSAAFQPGSLRAKLASGSLTKEDIDAAMAAVTGKPPPEKVTA